MEASTLTGFTCQGSIQLEALVEQISELEKDMISYHLRIYGLESRLNAGADEFAIGEVIVRSPEELKAQMVAVQGEARNFGGFVCVYNILTRMHQRIKGEETMAEVMKHKKYLASLKMQEDEAINVYTFLLVVPSLFGVKRTTKPDISHLPTYGKWRYKSLQKGLGYDLEKMLDSMHRGIKLIIAEKYQRHPSLKALATEMDLRLVEFVSALVRWVDYTYESLLTGGSVK